MRINILTTGRFHVCDLARELSELGYDVALYSCVPRHITRKYGLPEKCSHSLLFPLAPLFAAMRAAQRTQFRNKAESLLISALDRLASARLRHCDVFIGMSGMSTRTANRARKKYQAKIWIERGSMHILAQKEILESVPTYTHRMKPISDFSVHRELADYALADKIVVPSKHAHESFRLRGVPEEKLFRNPYGVDLEMFPPTEAPPHKPPVVIMVGAWSFQKGCDVLLDAWRTLTGVQLWHVGPVRDMPLPKDSGFFHFDPVPQNQLMRLYSRAHVFALASRQEGLALVQAQALACGMPVVCSPWTGGADLKELLLNKEAIQIASPSSATSFAAILIELLKKRQAAGIRDLLGSSRSELSWKAYGARYSRELARSS